MPWLQHAKITFLDVPNVSVLKDMKSVHQFCAEEINRAGYLCVKKLAEGDSREKPIGIVFVKVDVPFRFVCSV